MADILIIEDETQIPDKRVRLLQLEAPVFDPRVLSDMFGDDAGVVAGVLEKFVTSMSASTAELHCALEAQDLAALAAVAHRIKGAADMIGAFAFGCASVNLEQSAQVAEWARAQAGVARLEHQWQRLRNHLAANSDWHTGMASGTELA